MQLTVLGNSSRYLAPLGAGTSYLLRHGDARILLDAGNGTHLRLAQVLGDAHLDAVVVSHFHLDTAADLLTVLGALEAETRVFLPERAVPRVVDLLRAFGVRRSEVAKAQLEPVGNRTESDVAGVRLEFAKTFHGCPGVAVRAEAGGRALAYLPDTADRSWLPELARDADLLVAHTLLLDKDAGGELGERNLSAGAAGRIATAARAKRLALSHIPFYLNARASLDEARDHYRGDVVVLAEGQTYEV